MDRDWCWARGSLTPRPHQHTTPSMPLALVHIPRRTWEGYEPPPEQEKAKVSDQYIPAYNRTMDIVSPLMPPLKSSVVLCPERSGAWCYYDTALGTTSWFAPEDAVRPYDKKINDLSEMTPTEPPPPMSNLKDSRGGKPFELNSLRDSPWVLHERDADCTVRYLNKITGCVRTGPWISLKLPNALWCYASQAHAAIFL